jgi:hypothetical protein
MHNFFRMHLFEAIQYCIYNLFSFAWFEFIFILYFVIKLPSLQKFNDNIKWILRFKHFIQFHTISMIKASHYLNFFDQALFSFLFTVSSFFGKGFHCITFSIFYFLSQINRREIPFSNFFLWFELFMETSLINSRF